MPIAHVGLITGPANFEKMRTFYIKALAPLGYSIYKEDVPKYCGLGPKNGSPDLWLHCTGETPTHAKTHVAFEASSPKVVDEWYKAAIAAGAKSNGEPGERAYVKGYYAAFVLDPMGNNIEALHWSP